VLYFEIYNLGTFNGHNDYDVSFYIFDLPAETTSRWRTWGRRIATVAGLLGDKNPSISQTIHRRGAGFTSSEDIAINIDSLDEGSYELVVSVEDRISGGKAQSSKVFYKTFGREE
jgi:hypothetical protein